MTLQHTLAFCFLGLLWLQEPVCLSDLIRYRVWTVFTHVVMYHFAILLPKMQHSPFSGKTIVKKYCCGKILIIAISISLNSRLETIFPNFARPKYYYILFRWAVEGHLPYYNATAYFPSHMKLSQSDIQTFTRSTVPVKLHIETLAGRLSKYITLPDIPRHQINIYIARYAVELQLPGKMPA